MYFSLNFTHLWKGDIPAEHRVLSDIGIPPFPAVAQHIESPDVEKEVKRLLCSDAEAQCSYPFTQNIFCAVCSTSNALGGKPSFSGICVLTLMYRT